MAKRKPGGGRKPIVPGEPANCVFSARCTAAQKSKLAAYLRELRAEDARRMVKAVDAET